jgi:hypothetical protein
LGFVANFTHKFAKRGHDEEILHQPCSKERIVENFTGVSLQRRELKPGIKKS